MPKTVKSEFDFDAALRRVQQDPQSSFSRILLSAERLFAKGDFASVGIRTIADEAELNVSTLHFHWRNKETLYEGVCRYHAAFLVEAIGPPLRKAAKDSNTISEVVSALVRVLARHPCIAPIAVQSLSGKDPATLPNLVEHDVALYQEFAKVIKGIASKGSLAAKFPQLVMLNVLYSTILMFVDTNQQQNLVRSSVYQSKGLQKKIVGFTSSLLELALTEGKTK